MAVCSLYLQQCMWLLDAGELCDKTNYIYRVYVLNNFGHVLRFLNILKIQICFPMYIYIIQKHLWYIWPDCMQQQCFFAGCLKFYLFMCSFPNKTQWETRKKKKSPQVLMMHVSGMTNNGACIAAIHCSRKLTNMDDEAKACSTVWSWSDLIWGEE